MKSARILIQDHLAVGKVLISLDELQRATGLNRTAARAQLRRIPEVTPVSPRGGLYLFVSPEHRTLGAPPFEWWLDACFAHWGQPYYVCLLSAASALGSSHQAVQAVQVMVSAQKPRRNLKIGRLRMDFFLNRSVERIPVFQPTPAHAALRVSNGAATMLDLVRYAPRIGGMTRTSEVIRDLLPVTKAKALRDALKLDCWEATVVQRLGYLLDSMDASPLAATAAAWLGTQRINPVPLDIAAECGRHTEPVKPWQVIANNNLETST